MSRDEEAYSLQPTDYEPFLSHSQQPNDPVTIIISHTARTSGRGRTKDISFAHAQHSIHKNLYY